MKGGVEDIADDIREGVEHYEDTHGEDIVEVEKEIQEEDDDDEEQETKHTENDEFLNEMYPEMKRIQEERHNTMRVSNINQI